MKFLILFLLFLCIFSCGENYNEKQRKYKEDAIKYAKSFPKRLEEQRQTEEERSNKHVESARCWQEYGHGDLSKDYTLSTENIDCRQRLEECKSPCFKKYYECDNKYQFKKDQEDCYKKNNHSSCIEKCNEKFSCNERINKALKDCYKKKGITY